MLFTLAISAKLTAGNKNHYFREHKRRMNVEKWGIFYDKSRVG